MARYASAFSLRLPKLDLGTVRPLRNFSLISKRVDECVKIAGRHLASAHHEAGAWFRCAPKRARGPNQVCATGDNAGCIELASLSPWHGGSSIFAAG